MSGNGPKFRLSGPIPQSFGSISIGVLSTTAHDWIRHRRPYSSTLIYSFLSFHYNSPEPFYCDVTRLGKLTSKLVLSDTQFVTRVGRPTSPFILWVPGAETPLSLPLLTRLVHQCTHSTQRLPSHVPPKETFLKSLQKGDLLSGNFFVCPITFIRSNCLDVLVKNYRVD